jgi:hypothetical protein
VALTTGQLCLALSLPVELRRGAVVARHAAEPTGLGAGSVDESALTRSCGAGAEPTETSLCDLRGKRGRQPGRKCGQPSFAGCYLELETGRGRNQYGNGRHLEQHWVQQLCCLIVRRRLKHCSQRVAKLTQSSQIPGSQGLGDVLMPDVRNHGAEPGEVGESIRRVLELVEGVDQEHDQVEIGGRLAVALLKPVARIARHLIVLRA